MSKIIKDLQRLVGKDELEKSIDTFLEYLTDCKKHNPLCADEVKSYRKESLLLSADLSGINKRYSQGVISLEEYNRVKNRIRMAFLELLDNIVSPSLVMAYFDTIEDKQAWDEALKTNTIKSYKEYFRNYPKGKYINETEKLIASLQANLKKEALEAKERRRILENISLDKTNIQGEKRIDELKDVGLDEWWDSLSNEWQLALKRQIGSVGKLGGSQLERILKLKTIDISNDDSIDSLDSIKYLLNLRRLMVSGTNIQKLDGVEKLSKLQVLDISYTAVKQLKPLYDLKCLKRLIYTQLSAQELSYFQRYRRDCQLIQK